MLTDLIPVQYRIIAMVIGAAIVLTAAAAGGAAVNGWRLDGEHQRAMATEKERYDDLYTKVLEQNRAVDALNASTKAADDRRKLAEGYAATLLVRINNRDQAVATSTATTCDGVLKDAWGNWR